MMSLRRVVLALSLSFLGCAHSGREDRRPAPDPLAGTSASELFEGGLRALKAGDLVRAEQYLAAVLEREPSHPQAFAALLDVCLSASRYQAALRYGRVQLARSPKDWSLRQLVASLSFATGDLVTARAEAERITAERPEQGAPHFLQAMVSVEEGGDPAEAERHLHRYLELAPEGPHAGEAGAYLRRLERQRAAPSTEDPR